MKIIGEKLINSIFVTNFVLLLEHVHNLIAKILYPHAQFHQQNSQF